MRGSCAAASRVSGLDRDRQLDRRHGDLLVGLRSRAGRGSARPDLQPIELRKPLLLALTRAIEDESCARAERSLLFGSFQRERFYRASARRWRDFARTASLAAVFADFERFRAGPPAEVPVDRSAPLTREWALVCAAPGHAVCLTGLELPAAARRRDGAREFEVLWSVEPAVVAVAAEICLGLVRAHDPELAGDGLAPRSMPTSDQQLRLATAITTRAFGRLS